MGAIAYSWLNPVYKFSSYTGVSETIWYIVASVLVLLYSMTVLERRWLPFGAALALLYSCSLCNLLYQYDIVYLWLANDLLFTIFFTRMAFKCCRTWLRYMAVGFGVSMVLDVFLHQNQGNYSVIAMLVNWIFILQLAVVCYTVKTDPEGCPC